jgi:uncharacterized protein YcbX
MAVVVSGLATTAVKGTRLRAVDEIALEPSGARGDRRFYLIDERDRMQNGKQLGELTRVVADYSEPDDVLTLAFPDGRVVGARVQRGPSVPTRFYSGSVDGRLVDGPWSAALTDFLQRPLRLVESEGAVDRRERGGASLISRASLARLAQAAGEQRLDSRRFRMLIEIDGVSAHAEDAWVGRSVRIGQSVVRFGGHVGRCLITSRHPDSGQIDLPTLEILGEYRRDIDATEPLPFGIYGEVLEAGPVRVGDAVSLLHECRESKVRE